MLEIGQVMPRDMAAMGFFLFFFLKVEYSGCELKWKDMEKERKEGQEEKEE